MDDYRATRLVDRALRCYPARWRQRHGDEAAELAALLIGDGASAGSIALSYLAGAAREWLTPRPSGRLTAAACALLVAVCGLGVAAVLVASSAPARAALTPAPAPAPAGAGHPHCRAVSPGAVPGVIRAMGELPVAIWEAGHDRSC
jgi:hypothetical protein